MPQFDFAHVFWPQLIWLLGIFAVLYFGVVQLTLPRLGKVVDARAGKINADLAAARAAKAEADAAEARYAAELAAARVAAREEITSAKQSAARASEARLVTAHDAADNVVHAAESRIAAAVANAEVGLRAVIGDNAKAIVLRVTGKPATPAALEAALDAHSA